MKKSNAIVKVDSEENWNKAKNYIPDVFTIVVYTYENGSPRVKMGDGIHTVSNLPFLNQSQVSNDETLVL